MSVKEKDFENKEFSIGLTTYNGVLYFYIRCTETEGLEHCLSAFDLLKFLLRHLGQKTPPKETRPFYIREGKTLVR